MTVEKNLNPNLAMCLLEEEIKSKTIKDSGLQFVSLGWSAVEPSVARSVPLIHLSCQKKTFTQKDCPPSCFSGDDALENLESQGVSQCPHHPPIARSAPSSLIFSGDDALENLQSQRSVPDLFFWCRGYPPHPALPCPLLWSGLSKYSKDKPQAWVPKIFLFKLSSKKLIY